MKCSVEPPWSHCIKGYNQLITKFVSGSPSFDIRHKSEDNVNVVPVGVPRGGDEHGHGDRDRHWDGNWVRRVVHLHRHRHEGGHADRHEGRGRGDVRLGGPARGGQTIENETRV